jgi:uncharacterized membrane protein YoaK (UPF0700 family)
LTWPSRSSAYLLALAAAAGVVDAASYLGLGRVFTANMTGNTVLLGVALARGSGADAVRSAMALGGFCLGAAGGVALIRTHGRWPSVAASAFWMEAASLVALLVIWAAIGAHSLRYVLIACSGIAMGAQSAAVRASDVRGVNTTYMTSTLLNAIARAVLWVRGIEDGAGGPTLPGAAWATYGAGALGGALAERAWHASVIAIPLAVVCAVGSIGSRETRQER